MVNFVLKKDNPFQLNSVIKKYKLDQDKYIHPKATYANTHRILKKAFPEKIFNLNEIKITDIISTFEFGDGFLTTRGKGATKEQGRASAIMEFCERYSWLNFDYKNAPGYTLKSFNELKNNFDLENIDKIFYIHYSKQKQDLYDIIKDIPLHWVQGYSLTKNKETLYPINWNNIYQSTNGLASGNIKEETILQAICEVIERHNISELITNLSNINTEIIDKDNIDNEVIQNLIYSFKKNDIDIYIVNATLDINVPTIMACGVDKNPEVELLRTGYGYGCHTNPEKAIIRAITEYCLGRESVLSRKKILDKVPLKKGNWQFKLNIDIEKIIQTSKIISCKNLPDLSNDDMREEILSTVKIIEEKGFETILINKTHPLINIPVYRVFAPGLSPGITICSMDQNEHFLIVLGYYQGNQLDKAKKYYNEHFEEILKAMELSLGLLEQKNLSISFENVMNFLNPNMLPIEKLCNKDYLEQQKLTMKTLAGNQETIMNMISNFNFFK